MNTHAPWLLKIDVGEIRSATVEIWGPLFFLENKHNNQDESPQAKPQEKP